MTELTANAKSLIVSRSHSHYSSTEDAVARGAVDERRESVHDQDREAHALGIGTGFDGADQHRDDAAANAKHQHAAARERRGHHVRGHKERAQQQAAGQQVHMRRE